jgi:hypothetical protein
MFRSIFHASTISMALVFGVFSALGQTPQASPTANSGITAMGVIGQVKSIDPAAKQMIVQTDGGAQVSVGLSDKTAYKRLPPGEKTLDKATEISLSDVAEGDRVWARGRVAADQKSLPALQLIVMSKGDIAKKREAELAEWRRPGVRGVVASVNAPAKEFSVTSRSLMGVQQTIVVSLSDKVDMMRYSPDSIKFSDAKPSSIDELKAGDQVRAVGERTADGTHVKADRVLSDPHRIVGGTVTAIDVTTGEVKINDLQTKKPLTVIIKHDTVLRRFPENGGMMLGGMMGGGAGGAGTGGAPASGAARPQPQGAPPQGERPQGGGGPGGGMRMGGGGMSMADLIERLPTITINDLKAGDMIILSSTQSSEPTKLVAFTVVAGVEPLLTMMAARQAGGGQPRPAAVDLNGSFGGMFGGIGGP